MLCFKPMALLFALSAGSVAAVNQVSLDQRYARRAYTGAPPIIPHEPPSEDGGNSPPCLGCHLRGGFVPKWDTYAPVVPHPERENCRQCHVPQFAGKSFGSGSAFVPLKASELIKPAMVGAPPPVPHEVTTRSSCTTCHSAHVEKAPLRSPHLERANCVQCHVSQQLGITPFVRGPSGGVP